MTLNPDQFVPDHLVDYRTSMKDKPHAQGTLFRVSPELRRPEMRQPRGYSPERMREVESSMGPVVDASNGVVGSILPNLPTYAQLQQTLARSTAPAEDIKHVSKWAVDADLGQFRGGFYHPGHRIIVLEPGSERGIVPLHELGHASSHRLGTEHSEGSAPEQWGQEEAFADNYAKEHSRVPGYKRRRDKLPSEDVVERSYGWSYFNTEKQQEAFRAAYRSTRGHTPPASPEHKQGMLFLHPLLLERGRSWKSE